MSPLARESSAGGALLARELLARELLARGLSELPRALCWLEPVRWFGVP